MRTIHIYITQKCLLQFRIKSYFAHFKFKIYFLIYIEIILY